MAEKLKKEREITMKEIISENEIDLGRQGDSYGELRCMIQKSFENHIHADGKEPLFTTDGGEISLYDVFLNELPLEAQQHYNCNTCRHFVNRFGGLVTIDENGTTAPVMWDFDAPDFFARAVSAVKRFVKSNRVNGVFITSDAALGVARTGSWFHMAVDVPRAAIHKGALDTAYQVRAQKSEDFKMLQNALVKYRLNTVKSAVNLLRSETMYRSEKILGVGEWLLALMEKVNNQPSSLRRNMVWKAVAGAPVGFCHISSTMIGTLLDDIEAGLDTDAIKRKFDEKMNPLKYQRPQAAPAAGNVAQAERIFAKLGLEASLRRRFARLDELRSVWTPCKTKPGEEKGGIFSHVATKESAPVRPNPLKVPRVTVTWEKFQRTVLPNALEIYFNIGSQRQSFTAIVTAADPSAPPIIKWDSVEDRCPFNWYVYNGGSYPEAWNMKAGWAKVNAIVLQPDMWSDKPHHGTKSVNFILDGCKDLRYAGSGIALFPEVLRSELHEVRATIEAYSKTKKFEGFEEASACGIRLQAGMHWLSSIVRVTSDTGTTEYAIDRWD